MTKEDNELLRIHTMNVAIVLAEFKNTDATEILRKSTFDVIQMSRRIDKENGWNYHDNQDKEEK